MSDEQYKKKLTQFYKGRKRMPTYAEFMDITGFKSKNAVSKLVDRLVEDGVVEKDSSGHLVPSRIFGEVKLLGYVEAGFPSVAEEELLDTISLDEYLIGKREATFLLKVKGQSMIEAGIHEGDMVIVERTDGAKTGDIVIAEVDGGFTMKYLRTDKRGRFYLEPANKKFKNIYPESDLKVVAVVKAVIRKYYN